MHTASRLFGADQFSVVRDCEVSVPGGAAKCHFASLRLGGMAVVVIQPAGGDNGVHRDALPVAEAQLRLHHVSSRVDAAKEWDAVVTAAREHGLEVPVRGEMAGAHHVYLDTRRSAGHILEFIWFDAIDAGDSTRAR
jgi:hypothetical protein